MPTSARLAGAILMAAVGFVAAWLAKSHLPDGEPGDLLIPVGAGVGLLVGWVFTGRHLDRGAGQPAAIGIGSAALLTFWVALVFSVEEMIDRSTRNSYSGSPTRAVQDVFNIVVDYAREVLQIDVVVVLLLGGLIAASITAFVGWFFR